MNPCDEFCRDARILIIDDEPLNVRMAKLHLANFGHTNVLGVSDARLALETFLQYKPDIVLLDFVMPHLDGYMVMQQLQEHIATDEFIPIVMLTGDHKPETRKKALLLGARDFILKPFDPTELRLRLRNLLEMRFMRLRTQRRNDQLEVQVTERTQQLQTALTELRETQRQVVDQERLRAFAEMAGGIAHDFNNNLMVLMAYCDLLLHTRLPRDEEKTRETLQTMLQAATDAAQIVGRLKHFYRARDKNEVYGPVKVSDWIQAVAQLAEPRWKSMARGLGGENDLATDVATDLLIHGNGAELREALLNLIFNAVDAMPQGGKIGLRAREVDGQLVLSVSDTGTGMTEEVRRHCLEPFFTTKGEKGTGLGLAMVFGIIRRHDGLIDIASEPGHGTTFTITLPLLAHAETSAAVEECRQLRPLRILFADDNAKLRQALPQQLGAAGHHVTVAADGVEALQLFEKGEYDLVLTDLSMPRLNGHALADALRTRKSDQKIVMLTGLGDMLQLNGNKPATVDLVIDKPVAFPRLIDEIARLVA